MKFLSAASLALLGVATFANAQEVEEAGSKKHYHYHSVPAPPTAVRATFTTSISGAEGTVTITDNTDITADIEITDLMKIAQVAPWNSCSTGGLIWSIQEFWPNENADEMFGDDCLDVQLDRALRGGGEENLGGRYDPGYACSLLSQYQPFYPSGQPICDILGNFNSFMESLSYRVRNGQTLFNDPTCPPPQGDLYTCTPCLYQQYYLVCEVGDFSGKYGNLYFHEHAGKKGETGVQHHHHYHKPTGPHVHFKTHDRFLDIPKVFEGRALRISCNDGNEGVPLMCAKLKRFEEPTHHHKGKKY